MKKPVLLTFFGVLITTFAFAQATSLTSTALLTRLQEGILFYTQGNWQEAVEALHPVQEAPSKTMAGEALFWITLANMSGGEYQKALENIDKLMLVDPDSHRVTELSYHKGRALFYLAHYDEAIVALKSYYDSFEPDQYLSHSDLSKKYAALYWIGESLYSAGHLDRAGDIFIHLINNYPQSNK